MKIMLLIREKLLRLEEILLVSAFLITLTIAVLQIILRNFFDTGILWGDSFLRIAVLWLGMMGALFASRHNNHININLGLKFLSKKSLKYIKAIVHLFTAFICGLVAWYGFNLVFMEYEDAGIAFSLSFVDVPIWFTVSIIPMSFTIMAIRYLTLAIISLSSLRESGHTLSDKKSRDKQS